MCRQEPCARMSSAAEAEEIAAEESLSVYCKPVEFYNILQRRAIRNPLFLQRCLSYKIEAKHKRRIQMSVSLSRAEIDGVQTRNLFPLYIFLARLVSDASSTEYASVYRFTRACMLTRPNEVEGRGQVQATFVLPDMNKLASEVKSGSVCILLVSFVGAQNALGGIKLSNGPFDVASFPSKHGGYCLWGKIPMEALYISWDNSPNFKLGQRSEMMSSLDLRSCFLKLSCANEEKYISIEVPYNLETVSNFQQVQVIVSAEEFGAREKSPYSSSYVCNDVPSSSLSRIIQLRAGNVIFNYRYYGNKLQRTEVTEDFSCAFCLVKCANFKGLRCHLTSSHDLFNFEFWVTEEYQAVNVSVKNDDLRSEIVADKIDPKQHIFAFFSKPLKRKRPRSVQRSTKHVHSSVLESDLRMGSYEQSSKADDAHSSKGGKAHISGAIPQTYGDHACVQSPPGNSLAPPAMLQFAKTRKLSMERSDARNYTLLRKRQFFHSHRSQLMALEQVLSDRDSEDEVDDDVADLEDRRMLDDFVDVTKDEKQIMHMWNSFVRKQRVLADGHIPWACEAFSKLHGPDLVQSPSLIWRWRLFMIKLWNHGLLDARMMNNCNIILEKCQNKASDPTDK